MNYNPNKQYNLPILPPSSLKIGAILTKEQSGTESLYLNKNLYKLLSK